MPCPNALRQMVSKSNYTLGKLSTSALPHQVTRRHRSQGQVVLPDSVHRGAATSEKI